MNPLDPAFLHSTALHWDPVTTRFEPGPLRDQTWSALDHGAVHGAFLVERIRTMGGNLPDLTLHLSRLQRGFETLRIDGAKLLPAIEQELNRLILCNTNFISEQRDVSLVVVVSPGGTLPHRSPNCMMHCSPLPWLRLKHWHIHGTALRRSHWESGAGTCWPGAIKSRSRLNYYLADLEAAQHGEFDLAVLKNRTGCLADTSVANVLLVTDPTTAVSPLPTDIVVGTSLQRVEQLLHTIDMRLVYRDIPFEELTDAQEVWLTGNSGCVWSAASIDGSPIGHGPSSPRCQVLQQAWIEHAGFDWLSQAKSTSHDYPKPRTP
jgi:branched-subunit amino acid aminotransferase/4-amino-4-deoxychorismate lyase